MHGGAGRDIDGMKSIGIWKVFFMKVVWAPEGSQGYQATDPEELG